MNLVTYTAPTTEPVTVAEAAEYCSASATDWEDLLTALIQAGRESAELILQRSLMTQTWELYLDAFPPGSIVLPRPPVVSLTHVKYYDIGGTLQTLSGTYYTLDTISEPGRVRLNTSYSWPSTQAIENAVVVRYVAGYASAALVPESIKTWIKLRVKSLFDNRDAVISGTIVNELPFSFADGLLDRYRVYGS